MLVYLIVHPGSSEYVFTARYLSHADSWQLMCSGQQDKHWSLTKKRQIGNGITFFSALTERSHQLDSRRNCRVDSVVTSTNQSQHLLIDF